MMLHTPMLRITIVMVISSMHVLMMRHLASHLVSHICVRVMMWLAMSLFLITILRIGQLTIWSIRQIYVQRVIIVSLCLNRTTLMTIVSSDRTLTAYFGRTITVSANDSEYGNVSGGGNYPVGAECKVEATPAEGCVFLNWTENNVVVVDGENNPVPATYTFTVSGKRTLVANFEPSRSSGASRPSRPRDIYPAPAREPWDWADDLRDGEPTVPTVTTVEVTYVTATTATVAGKVTALGTAPGGATLSEAGIWYSTTNDTYDATDNPGTFVAATSPEVGTAFSVELTDLNADKTYYVRAYAKNNVVDDYGFGAAMSFRYNPAVVTGSVTYTISVTTGTNITPTIIGNKVSDKGESDLDLTAAGIWYSTSGDTYDGTSNPGTFLPVSSTPDINAEYSVTLDCTISPDQPCYARAYASNANGTYFGEVCDVTFKSPKVTTKGVSYTNDGKPQVKGVVTDKVSGDAIVNPANAFAVGIWYSEANSVYDATGNPGTFKPAEAGSFTTEYTVTLSGLDASKTYYARAYVTYNSGITYYFGEAVSFSKNNFVIVTGNITNVTGSSATVNCTLMSAGTESVSEIGIWWSKEGPTYDASSNQGHFIRVPEETTIEVGTEYTVELTGLQGFNQYVRAYAKVAVNSGGGGEGKDDPTYNYLFGNLSIIYTNSPSVSYNTSDYGGGIYMTNSKPNTPTKLVFSGPTEPNPTDHGIINYNYASEAGGGIYIDKSAYMQMKGHCEVNANRVPEGKRGGGIYLDGRLYVGEGKDDAAGTHGLIVNKNYAITATDADFAANYSAIANGTASPAISDTYKKALNNVFLTRYESDFKLNWEGDYASHDDDATVITLLSDISGKDTGGKPYTNIGFHVLRGFCPVVATSEEPWGSYVNTAEDNDKSIYENWLYSLMGNDSGSSSGSESSGLDANGALFEDTDTYVAIHVRKRTGPPFLPKYIYLWGCWTYPAVNVDPESKKPMVGSEHPTNPSDDDDWMGHYVITDPDEDGILHWDIYSEEGLSWFSSYVNGLNTFTPDNITTDDPAHEEYEWSADKNPYASAKIMNDLDMSSHIWTPIGSVTTFNASNIGNEQSGSTDGALFFDDPDNPHHFKGSFDGQGHIIRGVNVRYVTGIYKYGLFGYLDEGASVKNVFVDESNFITDDPNKSYTVGGIAGLVTAKNGKNIVISGSEARVEVDITSADKATSYVGGLVGNVADGAAANHTVIHSSMAMPEIHGSAKYVGGLVGELGANNNLFNSFSNPKFPEDKYTDTIKSGDNIIDSIYFGGLVGINNGIVENCYSRLQDSEPIGDGLQTGKSIFGWLAGTNNGTINYSYAPHPSSGTRVYVRKTESPGNNTPLGHGTYTATQRYSGKYGFKHRDHIIEAANTSTTLLVTDIDATGLTNQSFGGGGSNGGSNNGNSQQPATLSTTTSGGLMTILNAWVELNYKANEAGKNYATWTRTMASPINDDYPVPMLADFNSVGSKDKIYLLYEDDVNHMWNPNAVSQTGTITTPGKDFQAFKDDKNTVASMYLYDVQPILNAATGNAPAVYATVDITGNTYVPLYINEDVGITQPENTVLTARAGVTIKNARDDESNPNWHLFSSAIKKVPIGIEYHTATDQSYIDNIVKPATQHFGHPHTTWSNRNEWDPPRTTWKTSIGLFNYSTEGYNGVGYFPTNTPYGTWRPDVDGGQTAALVGGFFDLYEYNEYYYHWINYKREGTSDIQDHWHWDKDGVDAKHYRLGWDKSENARYFNDTEWVPGKGYLMALSSESMMMADGILNTGNVTIGATKTAEHINLPPNGHGNYNYTTEWRALNMIGNPYQSYLDFDKFVEGSNNGDILGGTKEYAVADDSKDLSVKNRYRYYVYKQSENSPYSASRYIHPHQGFFVKAASSGDITFNNDMRVAGKIIINNVDNDPDNNVNSPYRGDRNYPLVNLLCYDEDGNRDLTTVEVNRPEFGGGHKMEKLHESKGLIYAHLENESFQTLFTPVGVNVVPVRFVPNEDGIFTLNWNTRHGEFSYLHLIDNIAGVDVDCLTNDEYKFEGKTSDYKSRFKLVFRCDGDEPEDPEEPDDGDDSDHFAFMFGDELVVNGAGLLQMFDIQGRCLMETRAVGEQSSHRIPQVSAGVYLLRLTGESKVKVQKMVIK